MQLYTKIFIGMVLGIVLGAVAQWAGHLGPGTAWWIDGLLVQVLDPIGKAFIQALKFVVVPLVFASLVTGICSLGDIRHLGSIGLKTIGYFVGTTTAAVTIGILVATVLQPGKSLGAASREQLINQYGPSMSETLANGPAKAPTIGEFLVNIIPTNPLAAMVQTDMLGIIFTALLFGAALSMLKAETSQSMLQVLEALNEAMVSIVNMIMKVAPIGVFALIFGVVARLGVDVFIALLNYTGIVLLGFLIHGLVTLPLAIRFLSGMNPILFYKRILPVFQMAFSTSSSSATLPTSIKYAEENLGVPNRIASFVLPVGATINMDGTAMYMVIAGLFVAQIFGIELSVAQYATIAAMAAVSSIGVAGIPGGSIPLMAAVWGAVGIPAEGIAIIIGMDRILDMCRTLVNVAGDLTCTTFVARSEGVLDVPPGEPAEEYRAA